MPHARILARLAEVMRVSERWLASGSSRPAAVRAEETVDAFRQRMVVIAEIWAKSRAKGSGKPSQHARLLLRETRAYRDRRHDETSLLRLWPRLRQRMLACGLR